MRRMMSRNYWIGGMDKRLLGPGSSFQVNALNSQVFPSYITCECGVTKQSALAQLKKKRALKKQQNSMS